MNSSIVYLCTDLLFTSKIRETALALGHVPTMARDVGALVSSARTASAVIVDLRRPDAIEALDALAADAEARTRPLFGFCDHERAELIAAARSRGCTALAKGKFSSDLKHLIAG